MVSIVFYSLLACLLTGIILVRLGLRGRRINDHPVCSWCGFDLSGVYPESVTCPECGAGLKRDRAVRIGVRRKSVGLASAGALMVLISVIPVAVVGYVTITGKDINRYKPLGMLLWEAGHADSTQSDAIASELMGRLLNQSLTAQQYQRVIAFTLSLQADPGAQWTESWGDLIDRAKLDGVLSQQDELRFAVQATPLQCNVRKSAHAGVTIPIVIASGPARCGKTSMITSSLTLAGARIDGRPVDAAPVTSSESSDLLFSMPGFEAPRDPRSLGSLSAAGSRAMSLSLAGGGSNKVALRLPLAASLAPGDHEFEIDLDVETSNQQGMSRMIFINGLSQKTSGNHQRVTLKGHIAIAGASATVVSAVAPTPELTQKLKASLDPQSLLVGSVSPVDSRDSDNVPATLNFGSSDPGVAFAFDVLARDAQGHEMPLGTLSSASPLPTGRADSWFSARSSITITINGKTTTRTTSSDGSRNRTVEGKLPARLADESSEVQIVLRPNPKVAESSLDLDSYYDGEIVFDHVPLERDMLREQSNPARLFFQPFPRPQPPARKRGLQPG